MLIEPSTVAVRNPGASRWYVVQTQASAEARAVANLGQQGYETFCPRIRRRVRHARSVRSTCQPLFPGYVFVALDVLRDRWRSVNGTRGAVRLLTQGELPQPVPHGVVENLIARTGGDGAIDWAAELIPGQKVRLIDGPLADLTGHLESLDAAGRVHVLLKVMGRAVFVTTMTRQLAPG